MHERAGLCAVWLILRQARRACQLTRPWLLQAGSYIMQLSVGHSAVGSQAQRPRSFKEAKGTMKLAPHAAAPAPVPAFPAAVEVGLGPAMLEICYLLPWSYLQVAS